MFRLYHSNDLDVLKGILLTLMQQEPAGLFEKEAILVQSQGMSHWLKLQLAEGLGIAAQVDFPLPSSFIWQVFNRLQPELPQRSHFDKQIMAWKLVRLLPALAGQPDCSAIAHYLTADDNGLKCYQLAQTIADVFDQYLLYRPDWLLNWELGDDSARDTDISAHPWQPVVWRALVADSAELGHSLDHRARLLQQLESLVQQYPERLTDLPKRLFVFGIAALPGSYWQVLQAISPVIDIHFFLLNPCRNFWGDIISDKQRLALLRQQPQAEHLLDRGNPLLASWGRLGRDFLTLVHETSEQMQAPADEDFQDGFQDIEAWVERQPQTLLQYLQDDILNLIDRPQGAFTAAALQHSQFKQTVDVNDDSVRLVSAHSPLREVQRLYDQILHWLDQDAELKPRDIVVMVPDIDQYAPYIDAVFASSRAVTATAGEYRIPWAIADQSMAQEDPLIDSFLRLLGLADSRFLITDVQDWLDVPAIRARFDIQENDLPTLRDWLARAQIRWGLDAGQRAQLGLPAFSQNSWRKGLRQLLLGYMLPDNQQDFLDDFPVAAAEGNDGELLGHLMRFIDVLEYWQQVFYAADKTVTEWSYCLQQMLLDLYAPDINEQTALQRIRDAIVNWQDELDCAGFTGALSPAVIRSWFNEQLGQQGGWQRFLTGPVNFCTLMPMRSIPFKAVCLLGMNDEDYPRRVTPVGFDLMVSGKSRRGDRSRREDDRYLFLEALCSAQRYLYISYRGHDMRENAPLQPSVLVAELQDYLCDGFCLAADQNQPHNISQNNLRQWLIETLPLQPYNPDSFQPVQFSRNIRSYQSVWANVAAAGLTDKKRNKDAVFFTQALPLPAELDTTQVLWDDVKRALTDPLKFFVTRRLKASFDVYWQEHETEEPFAPSGLNFYQLKQDWLQLALTHEVDESTVGLENFTHRQQALGQLPVNMLGQVWSQDLVDDARPLAQHIVCLSEYPLPSRALQAEIDGTLIQGELQQAFCEQPDDDRGYLLLYRVGDIRGRDLLSAWLDLLLATITQPDLITHVTLLGLGKHKDGTHLRQLQLTAPTVALAGEQISQALHWYWQCWCQPLAHFPDTLWQLLQGLELAQEKNGDDEQAISGDIEKLLLSLSEKEFGELASAYLKRCLPDFIDGTLLADPQQWLAEYQPLMQTLKKHIQQDELLSADVHAVMSGGQL